MAPTPPRDENERECQHTRACGERDRHAMRQQVTRIEPAGGRRRKDHYENAEAEREGEEKCHRESFSGGWNFQRKEEIMQQERLYRGARVITDEARSLILIDGKQVKATRVEALKTVITDELPFGSFSSLDELANAVVNHRRLMEGAS